MTTPIPEKPSRRQRARQAAGGHERPRLRLGLMGFLVAWLLPNLVMAIVVMVLGLIPELQTYGSLMPLLSVVGIAGLVIGLPLCLLVNWVFRYQLNQWVHVMGYALVGMLYGLAVLLYGGSGLLPMLIPIIGFPAAVLMALGRTLARPLVTVVNPDGTEESADLLEDQDVQDRGELTEDTSDAELSAADYDGRHVQH